MKNDRFLTGILAGILILIVLALAMFFMRREQIAYVESDTPEAVLHNYVTALDKQDYRRAFDYVAASAAVPGYTQFVSFQTANRQQNMQAGLEIGAAQISGDTAIVPVTIVRVSGGPLADTYRDPQTATLVREQGGWKIVNMAYLYWDWSWAPENNPPVKPVPAKP